MRINSKNKDTLEKLCLISGENKDKIRNFFESLIILIITNHLENEPTNIPFFGDISILQNNENEFSVSLKFEADDNLLKNIKQIKNGVEPNIFNVLKTRIRNALCEHLEK